MDDFEFTYCLIYYWFFVLFFVMIFYRVLLENVKILDLMFIYFIAIWISLLSEESKLALEEEIKLAMIKKNDNFVSLI